MSIRFAALTWESVRGLERSVVPTYRGRTESVRRGPDGNVNVSRVFVACCGAVRTVQTDRLILFIYFV